VRDGKSLRTVGAPDAYLDLRISPDNERIALLRADRTNSGDIWLMDTERDVPSRVTFEGANLSGLAWSPDSRRIAYPNAGSPPNLFVQDVTPAGSTERLFSSHNTHPFPDWSPDGRFLMYAEDVNDPSSTTRTDLQLLSLDGSKNIVPYVRTQFAETRGRFSPDGKWVAYTSDESGPNEVYVQSFPVGGSKVRISSRGGDFARWRQDGRELFYIAPDSTLIVVPIQGVANSPNLGEPKPLVKMTGRVSS
jgi:Tol biopolymer transport system component